MKIEQERERERKITADRENLIWQFSSKCSHRSITFASFFVLFCRLREIRHNIELLIFLLYSTWVNEFTFSHIIKTYLLKMCQVTTFIWLKMFIIWQRKIVMEKHGDFGFNKFSTQNPHRIGSNRINMKFRVYATFLLKWRCVFLFHHQEMRFI